MIEKNGEGVLGFITNHGYLDNPTFRGMRWHLLNTFDKIWVLDLHGNAKKMEVAPDGGADKNVFDIMQGVSIIIAVKKKGKAPKALAQVMQGDLWGARAAKYAALSGRSKSELMPNQITPEAPFYILADRDFSAREEYGAGFQVTELFPVNSTGMKTHRDHFAVGNSREEVTNRLNDLQATVLSDTALREKYGLKDTRDWNLSSARSMARLVGQGEGIMACAYRPFDSRWCIFGEIAMDWPRGEVMKNFVDLPNVGLIVPRQNAVNVWDHVFITDKLADDSYLSNRTKERGYVFPLYLYPSEQDLDQSRRVNFDPALFKALQDQAADPEHGTPDEVAVFDYIYGVLHCPAYRQTYAEFLKIDFPRIPWPASPDAFWDIAAKGAQLRALHLMQPAAIGATPYPFEGDGDSVVEKPRFEGGRVWINDTQSFANAPAVAWEFYIGGYQPAQKWLKDRRGRALGYDDIRHYQSILKILAETARIMETIEMVL